VPLGIQCSNEPLHDGLLASLAARGKLLVVALSAEGLPILLMESLWSKVLPTQCAEEVFRMPCFFQCSHHTLRGRRGREGREEGRGVKERR